MNVYDIANWDFVIVVTSENPMRLNANLNGLVSVRVRHGAESPGERAGQETGTAAADV